MFRVSMKLRMIFKFGVSVVLVVAVIIYFLIQKEGSNDSGSKLDALAKDVYIEPVKNIPEVNHVRNKNDHIKTKHENKGENKDVKQNDKLKVENRHNHDKSLLFTLKPVITSALKLNPGGIHLAVVVCGDRAAETIVMFKSAVLFASSHLQFHIFTEEEHQKYFKDKLEFWPEQYRSKIDYHIYDITFPPGEKADEWKKLFKPCASQRLFIPNLLTEVDSLVYVDTDVLFLSPIDEIHSFFSRFNDTQVAALAPEHEDAATGWYNRFARHPYYGALGLNSGVMLMNLTRIRKTNWLNAILDYYKEYKLQITWGDQDLLNIYFHYYPQQLYVYTCEWNYRPDHCMYMSVCKGIEDHGVQVLHGSRRVFHNDKQPAFRAVYTVYRDHKFSSSIEHSLLLQLNRLLKETSSTNCGKLAPIFTKPLKKYCEKNV